MLSSRSGQRRPPGLRHLAGMVVALFAFAQVAAFHHHASVEHKRCQEHGELVHAHPSEHEEAQHAAPGGVTGEYDGAALVAADSATHSDAAPHHHCSIAPTTREAEASDCQTPPAYRSDASTSQAAPVERDIEAAEASFRLAPKASPPVARARV